MATAATSSDSKDNSATSFAEGVGHSARGPTYSDLDCAASDDDDGSTPSSLCRPLDLQTVKYLSQQSGVHEESEAFYSYKSLMEALSSMQRPVQSINKSSIRLMNVGAPICDQGDSSNCWIYAVLNVLRVIFIHHHSLTSFRFSQAHVYFYAMLAKSDVFLRRVVDKIHASPTLTDKELYSLCETPFELKGSFHDALDVIHNFGLVPFHVYPDTYTSLNTAQISTVLASELCKYALRLFRAPSASNLNTLRYQALNSVWNILAAELRPPMLPDVLLTCQLSDSEDCIETTPLKLLDDLHHNLHTFVVLKCDPRLSVDIVYELSGPGHEPFASNERRRRVLVTSIAEMKAAAVRSLKQGIPVWFSCDLSADSQIAKYKGELDDHGRAWVKIYGAQPSLSKEDRLNTYESHPTHAMTLVGVDFVDQRPAQWRCENSWGKRYGRDGFITITDAYFSEYIFDIAVPVEALSDKLRSRWQDNSVRPARLAF